MPISGKYNFQGIKKTGAAGLRAALATSPKTLWMLKFGGFLDLILEFVSNWLANKGLVLMNIGAFYVEGKFDQSAFDKAMDSGWALVETPGIKLTPEQMKEIDDAVIKAADKFLPYGKPPKSK